MFKQITFSTCVLLGLAASCSQAAPILTLDPANGNIAGSAGSTVGWGFDLPSDPTNSLTIISSFLTNQTNAALGNYVDLIAGQGGPDAGLVDPGAADWIEPFLFSADPANQTGAGIMSTFPFSCLSKALLNALSFDIDLSARSVSSMDAIREQFEVVTFTVTDRMPVTSLAWHWLAHM